MGAMEFTTRGKGKTAQAAFIKCQESARFEHGHGGYTGTIAEKNEFTMIDTVTDERAAYALVDKLMSDGDARIDDKWGPAGCIAFGDSQFLFFGYASS